MIGGAARAALAAAACLLSVGVVGEGRAETVRTTSNVVFQDGDWSVFVEGDPVECFASSRAVRQVETETGKLMAVQEEAATWLITYWPKAQRAGEVSIYAGDVAFARGAVVQLTAGDEVHNLYSDGRFAWPPDPAADRALLDAARAVAAVQVRSLLEDGRHVVDAFSTTGLTEVLARAEQACSTDGPVS